MDKDPEGFIREQEHFITTQWTAIVAAGADETSVSSVALEELCRSYWFPLYSHVRRKGHSEDEAKDLTQEFFAVLLEKNYVGQANRDKGKFRSFLLASLNHFLCNEWDKKKALKRGGDRTFLSLDDDSAEERFQLTHSSELSPEEEFDKSWAIAVLEHAMIGLEKELLAAGKEETFAQLKPFLSTKPAKGEYEQLAPKIGMTANAIGVAVKRLRERYRSLIRAEIANTLTDTGSVEDEMSHLFLTLAR